MQKLNVKSASFLNNVSTRFSFNTGENEPFKYEGDIQSLNFVGHIDGAFDRDIYIDVETHNAVMLYDDSSYEIVKYEDGKFHDYNREIEYLLNTGWNVVRS